MPTPTASLDPRFSSPGAAARPWTEVAAVLDSAEMFWISTVRADGRPHVVPLPAVWHGSALYFCTGPAEQKAVNLAANPHCVLTTGSNVYREGLDVVVEGDAARTIDDALLRALADRWKQKIDWQFAVRDGAFAHIEGGDHPAHVFRVTPRKVLAFGKGEPFSQTRYTFEGAER